MQPLRHLLSVDTTELWLRRNSSTLMMVVVDMRMRRMTVMVVTPTL